MSKKAKFTGLSQLLHEYTETTREKAKPVSAPSVKPGKAKMDPFQMESYHQPKKPRYADKSDFLYEFRQTTRDLDKANPKDPSLAPKAAKAVVKPVVESIQAPRAAVPQAEAAHMSRYSTPQRAMDSFRILAGMVEVERQPWNPGIVGETRSVSALMEAFGMNDEDE